MRKYTSILRRPALILISLLLIFLTIFSISSTGFTSNASKIILKVDGKTVKLSYSPTISSGVIYTPAKQSVEAMGAKYSYNSKSKTVLITKTSTKISLKINSKIARISGKSYSMTGAVKYIKVPFIPIKYIANKLGYISYSYNSSTKTISLSKVKPARIPDVYLIGDSLVCYYQQNFYPLTGWGQVLDKFIDSKVDIMDYGIQGASTLSYYSEGWWYQMPDQFEKGDYLFIQFGGNDSNINNPKVYADPNTTYKEYLAKYINVAKSRGVKPVLVTSPCGRFFDENGKVILYLTAYYNSMKEIGAKFNVPVIDLAEKSKVLVESYGPEKAKSLYMWVDAGKYPGFPDGRQDDIHFQEAGAIEMARIVAEGIKEKVGGTLAGYLTK